MAEKKQEKKPFFKKAVIDHDTVTKADRKLAETPSLASQRVAEQGDWAASNNPSPEEQALELERQAAINKVNDET